MLLVDKNQVGNFDRSQKKKIVQLHTIDTTMKKKFYLVDMQNIAFDPK